MSKIKVDIVANQAGTDAIIIDGSGKVGVGTASPNTALHVNGVSGLRITDATPTTGVNILPNGVFNVQEAGSDITFQTQGTSRMTINSNGNVGIGETSPDTKLHVKTSGSGSIQMETTGINTTSAISLTNDARYWGLMN